MKRPELITEWCKREGKRKSALDAPQAREALSLLRDIIGERVGVDLYEIIEGKGVDGGRWDDKGTGTITFPYHRKWPTK